MNRNHWAFDPGYGRKPFRLMTEPLPERVLHLHLRTHVEPQTSLVAALKSLGDYRQIDWMDMPRIAIGKELVEACANHNPTLVFMQLQTAGVVTPDALAHAKTFCPDATFVTWCGDIGRDNGPSYDNPDTDYIHHLQTAGLDLALYSSWTQVTSHRTSGLDIAGYLQIGYDEDVYYPAPDEYGSKYDVVFLGQNYQDKAWPTVKDNDIQLRRDVVADLRAAFGDRFGLFGTGWNDRLGGPAEYVTSLKTREIYTASKAAVSLSLVSTYDKYSSDRLLRSLACGTPTFVKRFYDMESWGLEDAVNCVIWDASEDLINKLRALSLALSKGRAIGINGAELAKKHHTWGVRMLEMLPLVYASRAHITFDAGQPDVP